MKTKKCKVCKKTIKQKSGPGLTHDRCKGGKTSTTKKKSGKIKRASVRRYSSGSVTRSQQGRGIKVGGGWMSFYHGGRTGKTQHDKTWGVKVVKVGSKYVVVTRHGRRTGQQNETRSRPMSFEAAIQKAGRLMNSKLNKGYLPIRLRKSKRKSKRGR